MFKVTFFYLNDNKVSGVILTTAKVIDAHYTKDSGYILKVDDSYMCLLDESDFLQLKEYLIKSCNSFQITYTKEGKYLKVVQILGGVW